MNYTIKKDLVHGEFVVFKCPSCHGQLESPLKDAGVSDACPLCRKPFSVPGVAELTERQEADKAKKAKDELHQMEELKRLADKNNKKRQDLQERRISKLNEQVQAEKQETDNRFSSLKRLAGFIEVLAWLWATFFCGLIPIAGIFTLINDKGIHEDAGVLIIGLSIMVGLCGFVFIKAIAELILVLLAIETNTRKS